MKILVFQVVGKLSCPLAHLLELQFTAPRSKVLKIVVKMVSSNLEIMFLNAKLNMAAGISSSPVSLALLGGNAKVKSVCS